MKRTLLITLWFILVPALHGAPLEILHRVIDLELSSVDLDQWQSSQASLEIRIRTGEMAGSAWRLWIEQTQAPAAQGQYLSAGALRWTARGSFRSGELSGSGRVLAGEGVIDGGTVRERLLWEATGPPPGSGDFRGRIRFILEVRP